jgi:hypothetical protein
MIILLVLALTLWSIHKVKEAEHGADNDIF